MTLLLDLFFFFLGAILASFTGVVAERIYTGQSWLKGRSRCNSCTRMLTALDLVPVLSWLFNRGRCRTCFARISGVYTLFEISLGSLFVLSYLHFGLTLVLVAFLAFLLVLCFVVMYDIRHTIVPVGSMALLVLLAVVFQGFRISELPGSFTQDLLAFLPSFGIAAVIGFGLLLIYALSRGRAMGLGDAPVAFALSLAVGSAAVPGIVFSFWIGALIGILILVLRRGGPTMGIEVPFVPFLAVGFLLAFFTSWNPFLF